MIDIGMGDWIKDYNGYLLMKFTSKYRYQQRFLDGKLFFNTSDFFARCDDAGRSDHHEGIYRLLPYDEKIITSRLMKLEDAASDGEGKLYIYK